MTVIKLDFGVTWDNKIVWFDTDLANALSSYMTPENYTSANFEKPF